LINTRVNTEVNMMNEILYGQDCILQEMKRKSIQSIVGEFLIDDLVELVDEYSLITDNEAEDLDVDSEELQLAYRLYREAQYDLNGKVDFYRLRYNIGTAYQKRLNEILVQFIHEQPDFVPMSNCPTQELFYTRNRKLFRMFFGVQNLAEICFTTYVSTQQTCTLEMCIEWNDSNILLRHEHPNHSRNYPLRNGYTKKKILFADDRPAYGWFEIHCGAKGIHIHVNVSQMNIQGVL
jgi:hypothetical protein